MRLTWEHGDARRWALDGAKAGVDAVIAAGGDGTLHEVVHGVLEAGDEASSAVGVLPFGTANDFAAAAGLVVEGRGDAASFLERITSFAPRDVDLIRVRVDDGDNDRILVNVATAGTGTEATRDAPPGLKRVLGDFAYLLTGLARVSHLEAWPLRLTGPDFEWSGRVFAVAVGNARRAGGGMRLCPRAHVDDGLLDLTIAPEMPLEELLPSAGESLLLGGGVPEHEPFVHRQLEWLDFEAESEQRIHLDGEPVDGRRFRFEVERGRLPMLLPSSELFVGGG